VRLTSGSTVAILGGGPSGTAAALALLQGARGQGLRLRVVIFEGKYFKVHHNQCVGVLSPPLESMLARELGLSLPSGLVKRRVYGYRLHAGGNEVFLLGDEKEPPTYTVRRVQFDQFMLEQAMAAGAEVVHSRVNGLEFVGSAPVREVRIYAEAGYMKADAVVCAFGLDEGMLGALEQATRHTVRYRRPARFLRTFITKIQSGAGFIEGRLGNTIHAYLMPAAIPSIEFGAISPKEAHVVVNIAGEKVTSLDMDAFLQLPEVRSRLPRFRPEELPYYEGRFPTAPARGCYGDRFVVVGDATGWLRPFKGKGINTAIATGVRAARVMLEEGLSARALSRYQHSCRELLADYGYGSAVRAACALGRRLGLLGPLLELAKVDADVYEALYDSVSGHDSYRHILGRLARPATLRRLAGRLGRRLTPRRKTMESIEIRQLTPRDIEAIMEIDRKITGRSDGHSWEPRLAACIARDPQGCLVAESGGRVVGFILGDIRGWEFNIPLCGWIDVMGVDPAYQGRGVGRRLVAALFEHFRRSGIQEVNALVNWNEAGLVEYFRSLGFRRGEFVHLQMSLSPPAEAVPVHEEGARPESRTP
jgi:flavin-dependent dehydrogenase/ribosomal protein S18 acetylase RimI-like enzyme